MGLFDNLMYPDNGNRANRVAELGNDCREYLFDINDHREMIDRALATTNPIIKAAYAPFEQSGVTFAPIELGPEWVSDVASIISPIFVAGYAVKALDYAARLYLRQVGRIGEAALADIAGLPRWFEAGKVVGGLAAAVAVEAIIDAATGAKQRDDLQSAIHKLRDPRVELKRCAMINDALYTTVLTTADAYEVIAEMDPPPSKKQLDEIATRIVAKHQFKIDSITDAAVHDALSRLDVSRGSWTNEDN